MRSHGLGHMHTDGGNLLLANPPAGERPDPRKFGDALGGNAEVIAGKNQGFFHQPDKIDRSEMRTALARQVAAEVEDGVSDELAGPVIGDISAAVDLVDLGAAAGQQFVAGKNVGAGCIATQGEHGRVFQQDERIANGAGFPRSDNFSLYPQTFCVGDAAELKEMHVHVALQTKIAEAGMVVGTAA